LLRGASHFGVICPFSGHRLEDIVSKLTKTQFVAALVESTGLDRKAVNSLLDAVNDLVAKQLKQGGPGEVTIPGLVKLKAKETPATQDRPGKHPFTGEPITVKGKPASFKVRTSPVKQLKDALSA
jgi:DNA-binding protein HU-beta